MEDKELLENEELEEEEVEEAKEPSSNNSNGLKASTPFERTIQSYLDNYASQDEAFKERYNNPDKNIVECCNYIMNQVKKSGCNGFADEEIYKMARDYYVDEISKDDTKAISGTVVVNHTVELTEEEKVKARVEAMKKLEEEILQEERKKREEEQKAQAKEDAKNSITEEQKQKFLEEAIEEAKREAKIKAEEKLKEQERIRKEKEAEKKRLEAEARAKAEAERKQTSLFDFLGGSYANSTNNI